MPQDWKELLGAKFNVSPVADEPTETPPTLSPFEQQGAARLDIVLDRKGRKGKTATIVCGFVCDEEALKSIAAELKKHCGTGGSARGGEILLQGDCRNKTLEFFNKNGLKARII